jgi:heme exporter protein C
MFNIIIGVWVAVGMVIGFSMPPATHLATTPIAFFHVPMAVTMLLLFILAACYGAAWLRLRKPHYDALAVGFAEAGFAGCLVTMATGMIFSRTNWGAYWSWDPQQVGVLGTLLTYAALFALRGAIDDDRKRRDFFAVYAIIGAMVACFGSYVYRHILPPGTSLHPNGTLTGSDALFEFALWFNAIGFAMLMIKAGLLRARQETARTKWRELAWEEI